MRLVIAVALACLARAGNGRRLHMTSEYPKGHAEAQSNQPVEAFSTLATLLQSPVVPQAGWQLAGTHSLPVLKPPVLSSVLRGAEMQAPAMAEERISEVDASAQAAMEAVDKASLSSMSEAPTEIKEDPDEDRRAVFPLAAVVGQEAIKTALLLVGVNPSIRGVVISGSRGTAKSVMARAMHKLLPPIERIKGSRYNIDPANPLALDSFLEAELKNSGKKFEDLETEVVPTPFVQVPLDVLEDRLLGSVDVEKSVKEGRTVFEPGLLANAHRGVLYIDDINLLDESISNLLLEAFSTGFLTIEREGLSVRHPFRPILVATFNPEELELRDHLMDRIGICLSADVERLTEDDRIEASMRAIDFGDDPEAFNKKYQETTESMQTSIIFAREYMKSMDLAEEQIKYLCESAVRAGVQGNRAELFAAQIARANAALNGADRVTAEDLKLGVKLAIVPRGTEIQAPPEDEQMQQPPPPPPPQEQQQEEDQEKEEEKEPEPEQEEDDSAPPVPEEFMFDVEGVVLDPEIMKFAQKAKSGKSGSRGMIFSEERGRYIKPLIPKGKVRKLAVDATMRQAAPFQAKRRIRAKNNPDYNPEKKVYIQEADIRAKKMARKAGSLVVFVVDASGSMALNRMNAAKGAAINLLTEAYESRDKVSLISFQGDFAQVILPPTRSIAMAKNRLEKLPCGGGSPLAHALNQAAIVGMNAQKSGDVGEVLVVCISDGRANVPLSVSDGMAQPDDPKPDKKELKEEVLNTAKMLGSLSGFKLLILDTEDKWVSTGVGKEIANAAQGRYYQVPKAGEKAVANVAAQAVAEMKR